MKFIPNWQTICANFLEEDDHFERQFKGTKSSPDTRIPSVGSLLILLIKQGPIGRAHHIDSIVIEFPNKLILTPKTEKVLSCKRLMSSIMKLLLI